MNNYLVPYVKMKYFSPGSIIVVAPYFLNISCIAEVNKVASLRYNQLVVFAVKWKVHLGLSDVLLMISAFFNQLFYRQAVKSQEYNCNY